MNMNVVLPKRFSRHSEEFKKTLSELLDYLDNSPISSKRELKGRQSRGTVQGKEEVFYSRGTLDDFTG